MRIVPLDFEILTPFEESEILEFLERCGRTAYKSEERISHGSAETFVKMLINKGHESVLEHVSLTIKFICDRGVSHELVRHRLASYTQESTRYCDYSGALTVVESPVMKPEERIEWEAAMADAERHYAALRKLGAPPQIARHVLPLSTKTEVVTTMNIRQWRHVLQQRTSEGAHPHISLLMGKLLEFLQASLPTLFMDIRCY